MSFNAGRLFAAALVVSLFIQMQITENGYASRRTKIAFTSTRDGNGEIYVMDGDGRNQRRVTVNPARDEDPAWSPDGKKIAFVSNRNNVNKDHKQIWVIDADGKNPIRLTDGLNDVYPDWSPDGTRIVYDVPLGHPAGITVMDADGKDKRLLTRHVGGRIRRGRPTEKDSIYLHSRCHQSCLRDGCRRGKSDPVNARLCAKTFAIMVTRREAHRVCGRSRDLGGG